MSSEDFAIRVSNLSKRYEIYDIPRERLKQFVLPRLQRILGQAPKQYYSDFWALKDVTFEVKKGETVGIIGRNGSGKSTLLQIICGTLNPTFGEVETRGRIAALLELGSGFNLEFTGRENVYMNCGLLGLCKDEINDKFDSIVDFADIGDFIDQPVKTYSSGMFVRLAFAVQTAINPEILVVDEALAVGDVAFVAKCMRRMDQLVQSGTTILFVSHDVGSVRQLCSRAIWLEHGVAQIFTDAASATAAYLEFTLGGTHRVNTLQNLAIKQASQCTTPHVEDEKAYKSIFKRDLLKCGSALTRWGNGGVRFSEVEMSGSSVVADGHLIYGENLIIKIRVKVETDLSEGTYGFGYSFRTPKGLDVVGGTTIEKGVIFPDCNSGSELIVEFKLENIVAQGDYFLTLQSETRKGGIPVYYEFIENALQFKVTSEKHIYFFTLPKTIVSFSRIDL